MRFGAFIIVFLAGLALAEDKLEFPRVAPTPPDVAAREFETLDGFRMDLLAAEPLLTSPVCLEYDENGNAWVAEMRDYPFTDKTTDKPFADKTADKPLGRIRVLKDTDGDGDFDESTLFAEELSWPTGIAFWKGGIFVTATPDIWYLKDTDGDGIADVREKWFTGFRKFNIQAVMNNLKWGLDGKIYGAGGTNGGTIENLKLPGEKIPFGANDFRFDPGTGKFEKLSGGARFGHSFDDFGNRFLCNIRNPVIHVVLDAEYLARNPFAAIKSPLHDAAATGDTLPVYRLSPPEAWRTLRASRWSFDAEGKSYPRSELVPDGYFTSASGITIYRGNAYPEKFYGNAFLADVAGNLVHRQVLTPDGVTFKAERADANTEFVRSPDIWFRPVNFTNAPDGTLHVVDMYRETIEHPWSIPDDIKAALDLESGREAGRIWRLAPPGFKPKKPPQLGKATTAELAAYLTHDSAWWRETAHRLLLERQDTSAKGLLEEYLNDDQQSPAARVQALWVLENLRSLSNQQHFLAMRSAAPEIRRQAIKMAEPRLAMKPGLELVLAVNMSDPSPLVRFQTVLTLGGLDRELRLPQIDQEAMPIVLAAFARKDPTDPFLRAAILCTTYPRMDLVLQQVMRSQGQDDDFAVRPESRPLLRQLAQQIGARAEPEGLETIGNLIALPDGGPWKAEIILGMAEGIARSGKSASTVFKGLTKAAITAIQKQIADSGKIALDASQPVEVRQQALEILALDSLDNTRETLEAALSVTQPAALKITAVRVVGNFAESEVPEVLLAGWATHTPPVRAAIIETLLSRPDRIRVLLNAIENKEIDASQVPPTRQGLLMRSPVPDIHEKAKTLFASTLPGPRAEILKQYATALELKPDVKNGQTVYEKNCSTCHKLSGKGFDVGPNLETVRHHPPNQLLANILDPNREVSPNYVEYIVVTMAGTTTSGQILSETATSLTLRRANDVQETLLRQDIETLTSSGKSLMPEGLEKTITPQQMADLLGYLTARPKR